MLQGSDRSNPILGIRKWLNPSKVTQSRGQAGNLCAAGQGLCLCSRWPSLPSLSFGEVEMLLLKACHSAGKGHSPAMRVPPHSRCSRCGSRRLLVIAAFMPSAVPGPLLLCPTPALRTSALYPGLRGAGGWICAQVAINSSSLGPWC